MALETGGIIAEVWEGKQVTSIMASPPGFGLFKEKGFLSVERRGGYRRGSKIDKDLDWWGLEIFLDKLWDVVVDVMEELFEGKFIWNDDKLTPELELYIVQGHLLKGGKGVGSVMVDDGMEVFHL